MNTDKPDKINFLADEDLPIGHLQRFEKKLELELHTNSFIYKYRFIAVAASIIIILTSGLLFLNHFESKKTPYLLLANYSPDLAETEIFYSNILNTRIRTIHTRKETQIELSDEIKEFHESLKAISSDMKINPGDERLVDAFFNAYQTQIDLLDNIIEQTN
jgi:hypothetical protein